MRALLVSLALAAPLFAGCLAAETTDPTVAALPTALGPIEVPEGATLVEETMRSVLRFANVTLPFKSTITLPEGATLVRATGLVADDIGVSAYMMNEATGRRRCNTDVVDAWDVPIRKSSTCSGLAAIDPPGAKWVVSVGGLAGTAATVDVAFERTPLDGLVAQLDLTQLSMPTHELEATEYLMVPSFDGVELWVEVTLPVGEGPWPTIIASSPYNGIADRGTTPAMWEYWSQDWAKRGYAVVNADVRGFGMSGGCIEVWSENEQKDQAFLVDWVAKQDWSDGNVGFYGQSYVATTPVAAAVQAPAALKAIIAVAPVIDAYFDWHYGGVPNGENALSPVAYQVLTEQPTGTVDPMTFAMTFPSNVCDPTLTARANDPRAIYDAFYEERNFSARADKITAAVLFTQGFEDSNVKSRMIPDWFDAITAPKLGVFGHWVHQHPTRTDAEVMFLGWMDQYVKGRPVGFEKVAPVQVVVDDTLSREGLTWPPQDATTVLMPADGAGGAILTLGATSLPVGTPYGLATLELEFPITNDTAVAGVMELIVEGSLKPAGNGHFFAQLYDDSENGSAMMSYGAFNLAHRTGYDKWTPSAPGETTTFSLPFLPTEHIFRAGHTLRIVLMGAGANEVFPAGHTQPGTYEIATATLLLPTLPMDAYVATPATALR